MIKEKLLQILGDEEGPSSFGAFRDLLSAKILRFPESAVVPRDPIAAYGDEWHEKFRLPESPVGVDDAQSVIILADVEQGAIGLAEKRRFLFVQPLPRPMFPADFYLAWGTCELSYTTTPQRLNAAIAKKGELVVGGDAKYADVVQSTFSRIANPWQQKCEAMICPGVTTAFEQLAYLAKSERTID